jgi:nucleolar protein 15
MAEATAEGSPKAKAKKEPKEPVVTNPRSKLLIANRIQSAVPNAERGVVYVGRLPKEFFEPDLHKFFSQFGDITRLRLSRSKKNAHSKGYAYIEFELQEVAEIVAKEMNKYYIMSQQIVCELMEKEKIPAGLFKNCNSHMKDMTKRRRETAIAQHNKGGKASTAMEKRRDVATNRAKARLAALGISYDLSGVDDASKGKASPVAAKAASPKLAKAPSPKLAKAPSPKPAKAPSPKTSPKASPKAGAKAKKAGQAKAGAAPATVKKDISKEGKKKPKAAKKKPA